MLGILISEADSASVTIEHALKRIAPWEQARSDAPAGAGGGSYYTLGGPDPVEMRSFEALHLNLERPAEAFSERPSLLVFASRHAGQTGPLLTAHTPGNFGDADYGGEPRSLPAAAPAALGVLRNALGELAPERYEVGMECTHHGPTDVGCPSLFAELGSSENEWTDPVGAAALAEAILELRGVEPTADRSLLGLGGGHYTHRFERLVVDTDWRVGHVAADWAIEELGELRAHPDLLERAFDASDTRRVLLDGDADTTGVRAWLDDHGYEAVSETWLRETSGVPGALVGAVEAELGAVETGTRFGERTTPAAEWVDTELPAELLQECTNIDIDRTRALVARNTVAFDTTEGGTIPTSDVLAGEGARQEIVAGCLAILRERYDAVEGEADGDRVVVRIERFDAEKAQTLGVPEGPAFGRLAAGEPIEVDGREIEPAAVRTLEEREFDL